MLSRWWKKHKKHNPQVAWENQKTNAYGQTMTNGEKVAIDNYNNANVAEGASKDANYTAERANIAQKNGTVQYKMFIKKHLDRLGSILGVMNGR